ncbi:hypothetical protein A8F95_12145 [Bacillus wudalianchiensis]|uniref:Group-specific protein n=2 Tax=Pseudobacillus wudalianchiensis TaxID=1743143 RepID=A0A1B9AJH6_9BACI|nr:hypothetical protein A8F95_12145 [Bacillus wudalianchiensis]
MSLAIVLIIILVIIAGVSTLLLTGKGDEDYRNKTSRNTMNLSLIYLVVLVLSFMAVGVYIKWFA